MPDTNPNHAAAPQPGLWGAIKETWNEFSNDDAMSQAAALAFYTGLSLAPLLTVVVWILQHTLGGDAKAQVVRGFSEVLGREAAAPIAQLLDPASEQAQQSMTIAGLISLALLFFSATGVFAQLQYALNRMWDVMPKPTEGMLGYIRKRILSLGMLVSLLFLLMVSMAVSAGIQGVLGGGGGEEGHEEGLFWQVVHALGSLLIFVPLFALMFKYLPDVHVRWSDVWVGAGITAVLFVVGKFGLGYYLGRGGYESSYGAAVGSFVALLVWVYYSAIIVFIGAEATQVYARRQGHEVVPDEHAVRIEQRTVTA